MHRNEVVNMIDNLLLYGGDSGTDYDTFIESCIVSGIRGSGGEPVLAVEDQYEDIEMELWQKRNKQRLNQRRYYQGIKGDEVNESREAVAEGGAA